MGSAILAGGAVVAVAQRNFDTVDAGMQFNTYYEYDTSMVT